MPAQLCKKMSELIEQAESVCRVVTIFESSFGAVPDPSAPAIHSDTLQHTTAHCTTTYFNTMKALRNLYVLHMCVSRTAYLRVIVWFVRVAVVVQIAVTQNINISS